MPKQVDIKKFINTAPVGKIIKVKFNDGKTYEIVKYHEGIAGLRDCYTTMSIDPEYTHDWNKCELKKKLEMWFRENAPIELKECCKVTIPSMTNVFGKKKYKDWHNDDESEFQFDYFKDWHNRVKSVLDGSGWSKEEGYYWWLRSPYAGYSSYFCRVFSRGNAYGYYASYSRGVAPCFCSKDLISSLNADD